jgi:transcriptional regulator of heat shock response
MRRITGDKRCHLKLIYEPLINACKNFLILENLSKSTHSNIIELDKEFQKTEKLKNIFKAALDGLNKLKQTYSNNDEIGNLLTIYTNIIHKCLSEDENVMEFLEKLSELSRPKDLLMNEEYNNIMRLRSDIYSQFNNLWSVNKINMFVNIFTELKTKDIVNRDNIFNSIDMLLKDVHMDVRLLLKSFQRM